MSVFQKGCGTLSFEKQAVSRSCKIGISKKSAAKAKPVIPNLPYFH